MCPAFAGRCPWWPTWSPRRRDIGSRWPRERRTSTVSRTVSSRAERSPTASPAAALARLDAALAEWRGEAFAEFADEPWVMSEVVRLDELRLQAREERLLVLLALGLDVRGGGGGRGSHRRASVARRTVAGPAPRPTSSRPSGRRPASGQRIPDPTTRGPRTRPLRRVRRAGAADRHRHRATVSLSRHRALAPPHPRPAIQPIWWGATRTSPFVEGLIRGSTGWSPCSAPAASARHSWRGRVARRLPYRASGGATSVVELGPDTRRRQAW